MNWKDVKELLSDNLAIGDHIDPSSQYRYVLVKPNEHADSFRISIGATSYIKFTMEMLEHIYLATIANNNLYNRSVIYGLYPHEVNNHGCYVHVVGNLFFSAGIMIKQGNNFQLISNG